MPPRLWQAQQVLKNRPFLFIKKNESYWDLARPTLPKMKKRVVGQKPKSSMSKRFRARADLKLVPKPSPAREQ